MTEPVLRIIRSDKPEKWQEILSDLITYPKELLQILELDPADSPVSSEASGQFPSFPLFPLRVPRPFVAKMEKGNWQDPLLRQVWPSSLEELEQAGLKTDPLDEANYNPAPGLLHKYQGRVLLTAAPHCAIHCRYCFRRHFDYQANSPSRKQWGEALSYIAGDGSIEEVILSGGDPLALPDSQLRWLIDHLEGMSHLRTLRIHTRLPIVIPQRITTELVEMLAGSRLQAIMVVHCNHGNELDEASEKIFSTLATNGVILLNQSVVLKDVNDNSMTLAELSRKLIGQHVLPYYLHLPDAVAGTGHFNVSETRASELIAGLRRQLPGYLVPRLVREQPGEESKTVLR